MTTTDANRYRTLLEEERSRVQDAIENLHQENPGSIADEKLANATVNQKSVAPYVAIQGFYANDDATRDKAIMWAKKAVARNGDDPLAILCLSALYGAQGNLATA